MIAVVNILTIPHLGSTCPWVGRNPNAAFQWPHGSHLHDPHRTLTTSAADLLTCKGAPALNNPWSGFVWHHSISFPLSCCRAGKGVNLWTSSSGTSGQRVTWLSLTRERCCWIDSRPLWWYSNPPDLHFKKWIIILTWIIKQDWYSNCFFPPSSYRDHYIGIFSHAGVLSPVFF